MAKRNPLSQVEPKGLDVGPLAPVRADYGAKNEHFVVFKIADDSFGFRLDDVSEIVRLPGLAKMPLGPRSLLGLANLRGMVLPVVAVRCLLGLPELAPDEATRVIVINRGAPVGFVVDRIDNLIVIPANRLENNDAGAGAVDSDLLDGVIKGAELDSTVKILNPQRLLRDEFARLDMRGPRVETEVSVSPAISGPAAAESARVSLVSFNLGQQEYALPLDCVREIIPLPDQVAKVPRPETAVLGVVTLRNHLLPLVSLRALLGLPCEADGPTRGTVVVLAMGNSMVGMVADRTREILRIDPGLIDPAPTLLTRGAGDAEITSICRLDRGRRLVAVLSPDRLFRSDLIKRVLSEQGKSGNLDSQTDGNLMTDEQFVIFRLGDQEYGLPIAAVEEVARRPDNITRIPKTPAFVDGLMNLRGSVVPIVDLRRRFELAARKPGGAQRIIVLAVGDGKAGFIVDSISEVMKLPRGAIGSAPEVSQEQMRLIGRVANLDEQRRLILLINPAQLLDQTEAKALSKLDRITGEKAPKAS